MKHKNFYSKTVYCLRTNVPMLIESEIHPMFV